MIHYLPWRVGRSVGRTIYDARGVLIGVMDTRELAAKVVEAVNRAVVTDEMRTGVWPGGE